MKYIVKILILLAITSCMATEGKENPTNQLLTKERIASMIPKVEKTEEQWKKDLTPKQYYVLREKGTERAFTGEYYKHKEDGNYYCAGCDNLLFTSETKYNSGSGWPSFFKPATETSLYVETDTSHGMIRKEILCGKCDGHLGHVFEDGPKPTGLRYCVNSLSLDFKKEDLQ